MPPQIIHPRPSYRTAGYARAVLAGDTLYISGHVARDARGNVVGNDIATQAEQVFENIGQVLREAGTDFDAIVKMNIYALDPAYRTTILEVRDRYCVPGTFASTFVVPRALAAPELLVEIEAIAYIGA